jgi:hypothetical protein
MKKILLFISVISFSVAITACKTTKTAASTQTSETATTESKEQTYRLIISFTSKGAGTSAEKKEALINYVESHPKKPVYKTVLWGREGETDYCFILKELSKKEQADFVAGAKKAVAGSDQVIISENAVCQHKGR